MSHVQFMKKSCFFLISSLILGFFLTLTACSAHKVNVQQGNVITPDVLEKLKLGMNQNQIKSIMGSPLIEDPFRKNRWDYVYRMSIGEQGLVQSSHITLLFEGEKLSKVQVNKPPISEKDLLKPALGRSE